MDKLSARRCNHEVIPPSLLVTSLREMEQKTYVLSVDKNLCKVKPDYVVASTKVRGYISCADIFRRCLDPENSALSYVLTLLHSERQNCGLVRAYEC